MRESNPAARIPGDDRITGTLEDAGYPAEGAVITRPGLSPYMWELLNHPAVVKHGKGMSSDELASFTEVLTSLAQSRTRGTGHDQYAQDGGQQFEGMSPAEVAEYMMEELADVVNYASMSAIKVLAMARAMMAHV